MKTPALSLSLWGRLMRQGARLMQQGSQPIGKILVAALFVGVPAMARRRVTKVDIGIFAATATLLNAFDTVKSLYRRWANQIKFLQESVIKHSTPITRKYFFKNDNAADRVTLLGVAVNIALAVGKFAGGVFFNSAVLVADAGHSLSDLMSDFITLWAVQVARLPADEDHPYGHGKFEAVGSLFLSMTLMATGLSVGAWSYEKMHEVILASVRPADAMNLVVPGKPAMLLAFMSIVAKEWLFRVTKRVGDAMNSQILLANAWHHRSDAFSSVLSLLSIAAAILLPGFLVADSAAGILVAGMICLTGECFARTCIPLYFCCLFAHRKMLFLFSLFPRMKGMEILFESVKQLTDTSDKNLSERISRIAEGTEGVSGVKNIRARTVGSSSMVDMAIVTDNPMLSASAAQAISDKYVPAQ